MDIVTIKCFILNIGIDVYTLSLSLSISINSTIVQYLSN